MKIFIAFLASVAIAVNAQSPFDSFFPNSYNRLQYIQPQYQPYEPYEVLITTRRPYSSIVTNPAPTAYPSYNSLNAGRQPYNSYQSPITTRRPYISTVSTPAPSIVPSYNSPYVAPQSYKTYQTPTASRRPYIPTITTQAPTSAPLYSVSNLGREPYRQYQNSPVTNRPYIPILTNAAPTTGPNYNAPYGTSQSYSPFQTPTTTLRPYIPIAPSTLQPFRPPSFVSPTPNYYSGQATTVRSENQINHDGSYNWFFETDNGIAAQAQGTSPRSNPNQVGGDVQGSFSWTAPNGEVISYSYTADEYGYHPKSNVNGARK